MDQPGCRTAHGKGFAQSGKSQVAVQPVAGGPADDPAGEQVDDDGEVQPALAGPDVGDVGAPFLVGRRCREVLIKQVRGDRPGVVAVGGALEPPLLPSPEPVSRIRRAVRRRPTVRPLSRNSRVIRGLP